MNWRWLGSPSGVIDCSTNKYYKHHKIQRNITTYVKCEGDLSEGVPVHTKRLEVRRITILNTFLQKVTPTYQQQPNCFKAVAHNKLQPDLGKQIIHMAVDGLVKHEQGGARVILKDNRVRMTKVLVPFGGNKQDITSYRTELSELYSGYLFLI